MIDAVRCTLHMNVRNHFTSNFCNLPLTCIKLFQYQVWSSHIMHRTVHNIQDWNSSVSILMSVGCNNPLRESYIPYFQICAWPRKSWVRKKTHSKSLVYKIPYRKLVQFRNSNIVEKLFWRKNIFFFRCFDSEKKIVLHEIYLFEQITEIISKSIVRLSRLSYQNYQIGYQSLPQTKNKFQRKLYEKQFWCLSYSEKK